MSASSGGLVKGRKYILRSVPSFPLLTPSIHSKTKGNGDQDFGEVAKEKVAVKEWQDHQDLCAAKLMPKPQALEDIEECEGLEEVGLDLHVSAENVSRDGSEASQKDSSLGHCLQFKEVASNSLGSDDEILIKDPYYFNRWNEGALLLSEETKTAHQEKPTYVDEPQNKQDVELSSKECREVESNLFANADIISEMQHSHGSIAQAWQKNNFVRLWLQLKEAASNSLGSDEIESAVLIEDSYHFNQWSEGPLFLPEETKTVHQEKPAYVIVDEPQKEQDVELSSKECRGVESNLFANADIISEMQHSHGSIAQPEVNEGQNLQDCCNPQLLPEPMQLQPKVNEWPELIDLTAENMSSDVIEPKVNECQNSQDGNSLLRPEPVQLQHMSSDVTEASQKQSLVRSRLQFEEVASNSHGTVGSVNFPLAALSPQDSISSALTPLSKDLTASFVAKKMKINKLPEYSQPITSLYTGNAREFNQPMLKKQRNATPITNDDHRRGCNCKKSKCNKRYCGCFAAGFNCSEFCSCQGCLNRPFASASNIVQNAADIPLNNAVQNPCSSRSMCMQEDINPYGKKEDLLPADLHHNDVHRFSLNDAHGLSPLLPPLQYFDMSQLPPTKVTPLTPMTNLASMFGASRERRHNSGSGYILFGGYKIQIQSENIN